MKYFSLSPNKSTGVSVSHFVFISTDSLLLNTIISNGDVDGNTDDVEFKKKVDDESVVSLLSKPINSVTNL